VVRGLRTAIRSVLGATSEDLRHVIRGKLQTKVTLYSRVRVDRKEQEVEWPRVERPSGSEEEFFFEFSSKKYRVLYIFIVKNYTCGPKTGPGGLIAPSWG